jgi:hypothetical protein
MNLNIQLPNAAPGGHSITGEMAFDTVAELRKALTAGYGTDVSQLTGGGALRIQSLERTMLSTIQENQHFRLFNALAKGDATATVDEWTEQSSVGGFLGGSTNTETGVIGQTNGQYARRVGLVKYLMTMRQVSFVTTLQNALADAEAVEANNGALQLLTDAEYLSFEGNSSVVPTEFDGIDTQIIAGIAAGQVSSDNLLDARASAVTTIDLVNKAAATISGYGNFGTPTDMFCSQMAQADFDTSLDPAFRVPLTDVPGGGVALGAPVVGIRTSHGSIKNQPDVFIRDQAQQQPFEVLFPSIAAANSFAPASVTPTDGGVDASSQFTAAQAGNYYYYVTGVNAQGQSVGVTSAVFAVASGHKVTVTIARSAGVLETGYVIYRSRLNGGNSVAGSVSGQGSDFREMARIPVSGSGTTVYTDYNADIPGTTKLRILNMATGAKAINWRQLLPMMKFPLYPTNSAIIPWAQLLFGYLRLGKRRHHVIIKNVLPNNAVWKPFG